MNNRSKNKLFLYAFSFAAVATFVLGFIGFQLLGARLKVGLPIGSEIKVFAKDVKWKFPLGIHFQDLDIQQTNFKVTVQKFDFLLSLFSFLNKGQYLFRGEIDQVILKKIATPQDAALVLKDSSQSYFNKADIIRFVENIYFPALTNLAIDSMTYLVQDSTKLTINHIELANPAQEKIVLNLKKINQFDLSNFEFKLIDKKQLKTTYQSTTKGHFEIDLEIESILQEGLSLKGNLKGNTSEKDIFPLQQFNANFLLRWDNEFTFNWNSEFEMFQWDVPYFPRFFMTPMKGNLTIKVKRKDVFLNLSANGLGKESINFSLKSQKNSWTNFENFYQDFQNQVAKLSMKTEGLYWQVDPYDRLPLNFELKNNELTYQKLDLKLKTQNNSKIIGKLNWKDKFLMKVSGKISEQEPWAIEWTDGALKYEDMKAQLEIIDDYLLVEGNAKNFRIYETEGSFVETKMRIYSNLLVWDWLKIHTQKGKEIWDFDGSIFWGEQKKGLDLRLHHPKYGKLEVMMNDWKNLYAQGNISQISRSPLSRKFHFLDGNINLKKFSWDILKKEGEVIKKGNLFTSQDSYEFDIKTVWNQQEFKSNGQLFSKSEAMKIGIEMKNDTNNNLHIFNAWKNMLNWSNVKSVKIEADQFKTEKWLSSFFPKIYTRFNVNGSLNYDQVLGIKSNLNLIKQGNTQKKYVMVIEKMELVGKENDLDITGILSFDLLNVPLLKFKTNLNKIDDQGLYEIKSTIKDSNLVWNFNGTWNNQNSFEKSGLKGKFDFTGHFPNFLSIGDMESIYFSDSLYFLFQDGLKMFMPKAPFVFEFKKDEMEDLSVEGVLSFENKFLLDTVTITNSQQQVINVEGFYDLLQGDLQMKLQGDQFSVFKKNKEKQLTFIDGVQGKISRKKSNLLVQLSASGFVKWEYDNFLAEANIRDMNLAFSSPFFSNNRLDLSNVLKGDIVLENLQVSSQKKKKLFSLPSISQANRLDFNDLILDLEFFLEGGNNYFSTQSINTNFNGTLEVEGTQTSPIVSGEVIGSNGILNFPSAELDLSQLEITWDRDAFEQGNIYGFANRNVAVDCEVRQLDSCEISWNVQGDLNNIDLEYTGNCGEELKQDVNTLAAFNSIKDGCYQAEGNSAEVMWNFVEKDLSDRFIDYLSRKAFKPIRFCSFSGVDVLLSVNSQVDTSKADFSKEVSGYDFFALGCKTPELFQSGVFLEALGKITPFFDGVSALDGELSVVYSPGFLNRLVENKEDEQSNRQIRFNSTVKSVSSPDESDLEQIDQEVEFEIGGEYRYDFWGR